jgi:hypothetical protein
MKITVYFEAPAGAHEVAMFYDEIIYKACVPALEAKAWGYVLSESVTYEEETWVGLTDTERQMIINKHDGVAWETTIAIEQQLKEKNT